MSKDIIYREDAIKAIHNYWKGELNKMPTTNSEYGEVIDGDYSTLLKHNKELSIRIKDIPSADRPQGEWIDKGDHAECSNCGGNSGTQFDGVEPVPRKTKFCPYCGAHMKGVDDEAD